MLLHNRAHNIYKVQLFKTHTLQSFLEIMIMKLILGYDGDPKE